MPYTGAAPLAPSPAPQAKVRVGPKYSWTPSLRRISPCAHWPRRGDHPGGVPLGSPTLARRGRAGWGRRPRLVRYSPRRTWRTATASPPAPKGRWVDGFTESVLGGDGKEECTASLPAESGLPSPG